MGKRRQPVEPPGPPKLRVSQDEARSLIQKQLDEGDALLKSPVETSQTLEGFRLSLDGWVDYTFEVLRTIFSTTEYADSFKSIGQIGFYNVYESEQEKFNRLHKRLRDQFNRLQGTLKKIDLLQPDSASARVIQPAQIRPPGSIHIEFHGNVSGSAVNVGEIVRDIQNNLNQIHSQGADEFGQGIKALVETINSDPSLSGAQKQEALESVQYLSEAANEPPQKRKRGMINAAVANIPNLLKTAQLAGDAWNAWEPTIKGFLGQ